MVKKRLKFVGFWSGFDERNNIYYKILSERYDICLSEKPDYVIASMYTSPLDYLKYNDAVRIMHSGEDYFPDMNFFDYSVVYDYCTLYGLANGEIVQRCFRWPYGCEWEIDEIEKQLLEKEDEEIEKAISQKESFCNYIYAHESYRKKREKLLNAVEQYKSVDSVGTYRNNMPDGFSVTMKNKIDYIKRYKFTIAAETVQYPGMTTEKIYDAFRAGSIPIYYGDPFVRSVFDEETFIYWDGRDDSLEDVVRKIKEIDNNSQIYREMLKKGKFINPNNIHEKRIEFAEWLYSIFDLDKEQAKQHLPLEGPSQRSSYEKKLLIAFNKKRPFDWIRR